MKTKGITKKNKGFSLVEVLVVTGIVAIVSLIIASMMTNMFKSQGQLLAQQDFIEATNLATGILMNSNNCAVALQTAVGSPVLYAGVPTQVNKIVSGTPLLTAGLNYTPRLKIQKLELSLPLTPATLITLPGGTPPCLVASPGTCAYTQYLVNLGISASPISGMSYFSTRNLPITIYTDATNAIAFCTAQSTQNEACASLSMPFNSTTKNCVLGICDASHLSAPSYACKFPGGINPSCSPDIYYWAFTGSTTSSKPICVCSQNCSSPPAPPPIY